jgi:Sap, sulfolipid-1-addressing protein
MGLGQWRKRPRNGETAQLPGWMEAVDTIGPGKALGVGVLLSGVNPKNLTLCLSAGVMIGGGALSVGETAVAVAVFVVLGSITVAGPVVGYLVAPDRMRGPLDELRTWMTAHNAAVMTVLLLVIGTTILGKGVAGL